MSNESKCPFSSTHNKTTSYASSVYGRHRVAPTGELGFYGLTDETHPKKQYDHNLYERGFESFHRVLYGYLSAMDSVAFPKTSSCVTALKIGMLLKLNSRHLRGNFGFDVVFSC